MNPLEYLNIYDFAVVYRLHRLGPKTKMQLISMGLHGFMIENLCKYGILVKEHDPNTNLSYYKVKDELVFRPDQY